MKVSPAIRNAFVLIGLAVLALVLATVSRPANANDECNNYPTGTFTVRGGVTSGDSRQNQDYERICGYINIQSVEPIGNGGPFDTDFRCALNGTYNYNLRDTPFVFIVDLEGTYNTRSDEMRVEIIDNDNEHRILLFGLDTPQLGYWEITNATIIDTDPPGGQIPTYSSGNGWVVPNRRRCLL